MPHINVHADASSSANGPTFGLGLFLLPCTSLGCLPMRLIPKPRVYLMEISVVTDRSSCIGGSRTHDVYRQARIVCQNNVLSGIKSRGRLTCSVCK